MTCIDKNDGNRICKWRKNRKSEGNNVEINILPKIIFCEFSIYLVFNITKVFV